jgi:hypothetical protein
MYLLSYAPSWHNAKLINHRDNLNSRKSLLFLLLLESLLILSLTYSLFFPEMSTN